MSKLARIEIPNESFLSLAMQAEGRKELSGFGKAVTVLLTYLAIRVEQGATPAEIDAIFAKLKAGVMDTATRHIAENAPHAPGRDS